ncbi:MAG: D-aminoacyl-tRNA deacylase [Dehalococcoidia bacterium]
MRALLQRVSRASVRVGGEQVGAIGPGFVILVGIAQGDSAADADYLVEKTVNLRIFPDDEGRFNRSALDVGADLLLVSQFTLYADTRKGRRPSFVGAAAPDEAQRLFQHMVDLAAATGLRVETGRFQAHMLVEIHNDGPVTILLDSNDRRRSRSGSPKGQ